MPLHWLELRWLGRNWNWRALGAIDRTVGTGAADAEGWRAFGPAAGRPRVRLDGLGWIELVDSGAPAMLLHDLTSGERLEAEDNEEYVEACDDGFRLLDAPESPPLQDGQVVVVRGRVVRILLADVPGRTAAPNLDLRDPACRLDIVDAEATFTAGAGTRTIRGEGARVLRVYASARLEFGDGWLAPVDAHAEWVAAGGRVDSSVDRLGWERGKVRSRLVLSDVGGVGDLFQTRRDGPTTLIRLSLAPVQITVDGLGPSGQ